MSATVQFQTLGIMSKTSLVLGVSSASAGYGIENAADFNPDTYYLNAGDIVNRIDIDLGESSTVDSFGMWLRNYNTDFDGATGTATYALSTDDNDDGAYSATTDQIAQTAINHTVGEPIFIPSANISSIMKRYWRLLLVIVPGVEVKLSQIFLSKIRTVSVGNQWPEDDTERFFTRSVRGPGGRRFVDLVNQRSAGSFTRSYTFDGTSNFNALKNTFIDSAQGTWPLLMREGSNYKYVRFADKPFSKSENEFQLYGPRVTFDVIPYIADGENY